MSNIIKTSQVTDLSAVQAQELLVQVFKLVKKAKTLEEIQRIQDGKIQMEAFFKTRQAAIAMGDQIESLRAKLRELTLNVELQQGEITARMKAAEREKALNEFGISKAAATQCEVAASLPRKQVEALHTIQQRKGLDLRAKDLAPIAALKPPERKLVAAQLGEVKGIREAIEKAKALPDWRPSASQSAVQQKEKPVIVDTKIPAFVNRCRELRLSVGTLVALAERYATQKNNEALVRVRDQKKIVVEHLGRLGDPKP